MWDDSTSFPHPSWNISFLTTYSFDSLQRSSEMYQICCESLFLGSILVASLDFSAHHPCFRSTKKEGHQCITVLYTFILTWRPCSSSRGIRCYSLFIVNILFHKTRDYPHMWIINLPRGGRLDSNVRWNINLTQSWMLSDFFRHRPLLLAITGYKVTIVSWRTVSPLKRFF